jgi:DNA-binding CsgD family transcriptional regulator
MSLISFMALWRPLHIAATLAFSLTSFAEITLQLAALLVLVLLSEGKLKNKCITAIYLWTISLLIEFVFIYLFAGISGKFPSADALLLNMLSTHIATLLWAIFYHRLTQAMPQEAFDRVPLHFWLLLLSTPFLGAVALFALINPLKAQLVAGFNNFFFCGIFGFAVFVLDLCIFYLYTKLITSYSSQLLAGELADTPPIYTPANGLSEAFIEKYKLSKRQIEIIEALLQRKTNKEIANDLGIELNTVQVHLQNVYRKTGTSGRYAIMALIGEDNNK